MSILLLDDKVNTALDEVMLDLHILLKKALAETLKEPEFALYIESAPDLEVKLGIESVLVEVAAVDIVNRLNPSSFRKHKNSTYRKIAALEYLLSVMKRQQVSASV